MAPTTPGHDLLAWPIRRLRAAPLAGLSDAELLRLFTRGGPEAGPAFELVVRRHGPMVLSTCRAAMGDSHAADDCFQAVFLVLVRKGRGLRLRGPLGPWLFEVARRVCARARATAARRLRHEARAAKVPVAATDDGLGSDMAEAVHAEVGRLPRTLRAVIVLCDLAGLSYHEAADRLGVTQSTVRGRLARGRDRLRKRLEQRGLRPDCVCTTAVVVPMALAGATTHAAEVLAGRTTGVVSTVVLELVNGGIETMVTKLKAASLSTLTAGVLIAGALRLGAQFPTPTPGPIPATDPPSHVAVEEFLMQALDDSDPSDDVANLVRKAQRQQDRGDLSGARKTVKQVNDALKKWSERLEESGGADATPGPRSGGRSPALPFRGAVVPGTTPPQPPATVPTPTPPGFRPPATGLPLRAAPLPPPPPEATPGDVDARLREVEEKLERLLKQLEKRPPATNKGPAR